MVCGLHVCMLIAVDAVQRQEAKTSSLLNKFLDFVTISLWSSAFLSLKIFEMMDAKARQDCIKEIDLLKVRILFFDLFWGKTPADDIFCCLFAQYLGEDQTTFQNICLVRVKGKCRDIYWQSAYIVVSCLICKSLLCRLFNYFLLLKGNESSYLSPLRPKHC